MTDASESQDRPSSSDVGTKESVAARRGRRIGTVIAWALFVYLAAVGFASIPKQIFWPEANAWPEGTTCEGGLRDLTARLAKTSSRHVAEISTGTRALTSEPETSLRTFFTRWDLDHAGLEPICAQSHQQRAFKKLAIFRYRLATDLARMDRDNRPLMRSVEANLGSQN